jgi:transposase
MKYQFFVGCDVSKATLNFSVRNRTEILNDDQIENSVKAIRKFLERLHKLKGFHAKAVLFCLEHTGLYNNHLLKVLQQAKMDVAIVPAAEIKLSVGLQRGKDDIVDARRISEYAMRFEDKLNLWSPPRMIIQELQALTTLKERLIKTKVQLETPLGEGGNFMDEEIFNELVQCNASAIEGVKKSIAEVEAKINALIDKDDDLRQKKERITSIPGVGDTTAIDVIIETNEFKDFDDPRKFACYAGVAPFHRTSGSSVRGRPRVSHMANKRMKTLFHLCAMSAIRYNQSIKAYYHRKVEQGKNKMSVINAVRNKIIHIIFALEKNQTMYSEKINANLVLS